MRRIAIEKTLQNMKSYLESKGCEVDSLEDSRHDLKQFDAIIVSGKDSNFLGIQNTSTKASVINANGMTPEDVYHKIMNRIH